MKPSGQSGDADAPLLLMEVASAALESAEAAAAAVTGLVPKAGQDCVSPGEPEAPDRPGCLLLGGWSWIPTGFVSIDGKPSLTCKQTGTKTIYDSEALRNTRKCPAVRGG